jgi:hypothetical protein
MIVFDLKCRNGHVFEAWFNSASSFGRLQRAGHVACAVCGSSKIEKALNAPNIAPSKRKAATATAPAVAETAPAAAEKQGPPAVKTPALGGSGRYANDPQAAKVGELMRQLAELRVQIEKNCDYVGPDFAEEARKMHYGEAPKRNIYGEASDDEAKQLHDEGVEFSRIPWQSRRDS